MYDGNALRGPARTRRPGVLARTRGILLRRLWLPRFVYEALPYLYIACGLAALVSATYIPDWTWIVPWAILIGLLCLHAGLALATLRYRLRRGRKRTGSNRDFHR